MKLKNGYDNLLLLSGISLLMIAVQLVGQFDMVATRQWGILPRSLSTLPHILTAPWIHGNWSHLVNNLAGMWTFSLLCLLQGQRHFILSSCIIVTLGGLLVWCFARHSYHIGASGWIFGLFGVTIANAYFKKRLLDFLIAVGVIFFYGGMIFGVLPTQPNVSFESHFFGFLSGVIASYALRKVHR